MTPLLARAPPSESKEAVHGPLPACGAVADGCQVRHHAHVPKQEADCEIRADRKHIPDEWGPEVHPEVTLVRIRKQPIEEPRPAEMHDGKEASGHDGEHRHRFRHAADGCAPGDAKKIEDRGDQRSGVRDPNPENEGGNVDAPGGGTRDSPKAQAYIDQAIPDVT